MTVLQNYPLVSAVSAWCLAQVLKLFTGVHSRGSFRQALGAAGGMPSSHSATVCALCTATGIREGVSSTPFALAFVLAMIVMYDAAGVRRAVGEHAKRLNRLDSEAAAPLKELVGHTPVQVGAGAALGIALAAGLQLLY